MNGSSVVDASFAIKWVLEEEYSTQATSKLAEWQNQQVDVYAPTWFLFEITNALYQRIRRHELILAEVRRLINAIRDVGVELIGYDDSLHIRALELAYTFNLRASYDARYLALAESMDCELWTADERLWNSVRTALGWVRWIGEPQPNPA